MIGKETHVHIDEIDPTMDIVSIEHKGHKIRFRVVKYDPSKPLNIYCGDCDLILSILEGEVIEEIDPKRILSTG